MVDTVDNMPSEGVPPKTRTSPDLNDLQLHEVGDRLAALDLNLEGHVEQSGGRAEAPSPWSKHAVARNDIPVFDLTQYGMALVSERWAGVLPVRPWGHSGMKPSCRLESASIHMGRAQRE